MNNFALILAILFLFGLSRLDAQELPRPSMAKHDAVITFPSDYNFKLGPVTFNVDASNNAEFIDNVGLTHTEAKADLVLTPQVGLNAQWPVTPTNALHLDLALGYSRYLIHPHYDTANIAPNGDFSFDVYTGCFKINFHDQLSYQQDPASVGVLSNVTNFSRLENVAGIGIVWELDKLELSLGYDYIVFRTIQLQGANGNNLSGPNNLNYGANQISASATYHVTSTFAVGFEVAPSIRNYEQNSVEDDQLSAGPFIKTQLTPNLTLNVGGGFQAISTSGNPGGAGSGLSSVGLTPTSASSAVTTTSYYADVSLDHRLNKYYTEHFSAGRDLAIDVFSQQTDTAHAGYFSNWSPNSKLSLALGLDYENVKQTGGFISTASYNLFTAEVQASFHVTKNVSATATYQFDDKFASESNQSYIQNRIGLLLSYHF